MVNGNGKNRMTEPVQVRLDPELVRLLDVEADRRDLARNELWAEILAGWLKRPDLAEIPRKRLGRPRHTKPNGRARATAAV